MHTLEQTARSWLNTPFKHQGRLKTHGCDCLGLIMGIAQELGLQTKHGAPITELDTTNYALHSNAKELEETLGAHLRPAQQLQAGVLALLSFDGNPQHLGIISTHHQYEFGLIHADMSKGRVVEHGLSEFYRQHIINLYFLL